VGTKILGGKDKEFLTFLLMLNFLPLWVRGCKELTYNIKFVKLYPKLMHTSQLDKTAVASLIHKSFLTLK
jgi:hypothetical protein